MITAILIVILLSTIMAIISRTALIDSINNITRGGLYRFGKAFSVGADYFWRMLGLCFIEFFAVIVLIVILLVLVGIMFFIDVSLKLLGLLFAIPIGLIMLFGISNIFELAARALVLRNISIRDALAEGYKLLMLYKGKNFAIFLINVVLTIVSIALSTMVVGFTIMPIGLALYTASGLITALIVCIPIALFLLIVLGGFLGAVNSSIYTIFYFELLDLPTKNIPNEIVQA